MASFGARPLSGGKELYRPLQLLSAQLGYHVGLLRRPLKRGGRALIQEVPGGNRSGSFPLCRSPNQSILPAIVSRVMSRSKDWSPAARFTCGMGPLASISGHDYTLIISAILDLGIPERFIPSTSGVANNPSVRPQPVEGPNNVVGRYGSDVVLYLVDPVGRLTVRHRPIMTAGQVDRRDIADSARSLEPPRGTRLAIPSAFCVGGQGVGMVKALAGVTAVTLSVPGHTSLIAPEVYEGTVSSGGMDSTVATSGTVIS